METTGPDAVSSHGVSGEDKVLPIATVFEPLAGTTKLVTALEPAPAGFPTRMLALE